MKLYTKIIMIPLLSGAILTTGCNKLLDVTPRQSIDSRIALDNPEAIQAAVYSVYAYLRQDNQYGKELIAIPELLADNADHTNASVNLYAQFLNQPGAHISIWGSSYRAINEVNNLLQVLENPPAGVTQDLKETIEGQAHFLRALYYHNLSKVYGYDPQARVSEIDYGSVPLMTVPVLNTEAVTFPSRAPVEDVYKLIYEDLEIAYDLLQDKTIGGTNPEYYASAGAASALFSRVALYNEDYPRVIAEAGKALSLVGGRFMSNANYVAGWRLKKLPESIFEIVVNLGDLPDPANNSLRTAFTSRQTLNATAFSAIGHVVVAPELYSLYGANDVRRTLIINGLGRNAARKEITKFLSRSAVNHDNIPIIRVSELYLNRAEAYARSMPAQEVEARADLNMIRERAGLAPVSTSLSGQALLDEILLQRRLELAFEGHRFFDLKRSGKDIVKPGGNVAFDEFRILAPLPTNDTQLNSTNLKQNFGY